MSKINYDNWIRDKSWSLEETVGVVTEIFDNTKGTRTYKKALEDIKKKKLRARLEFEEPDFEFPDGGMDKATKNFLRDEYLKAVQENNVEQASSIWVEPRDFIKWRLENEGESAPKELLKFFNYDYWLSEEKECWSFNEAVLLFLSAGEPPFPHEIRNVFEINEEFNQSAKRLAQEMLDTNTRGINGEWLYWKVEKRSNGAEELVHCCPIDCEDFSKERIFLLRNVLFRIVKKHKKIFSYVPKLLLDKALKIIDKQDVEKIHSEFAVKSLLKMIRDDSLKPCLGKICTPQQFFGTLAKLPNEDGDRNMRVLMEIALDEISGIGLSEEDAQRQSDIKIIKARFADLSEYNFLFKKDRELNKINFLSSDGDEDIGRVVDFIEWARGHRIKIPSELKELSQKGVTTHLSSISGKTSQRKTNRPEEIRWKSLSDAKTKVINHVKSEIAKSLAECKNHVEIKKKLEKDRKNDFGSFKKKDGSLDSFSDNVFYEVIKNALKDLGRTDLIKNYNSSKTKK